MFLLATFAAAALMLTAIGMYGVVSYSVTQRTREFGIRIALGARTAYITQLVVRQGDISWDRSRRRRACRIRLDAHDVKLVVRDQSFRPHNVIVVPVILVFVALTACIVPARRATRVGPIIALRGD